MGDEKVIARDPSRLAALLAANPLKDRRMNDPARGFGTANRTRYSNTVVDNLLTEALVTMDDELRQQKLERAIAFAMADQPLIPVFYPIFDFAARKGLVVTPRAQRRFNALMVKPQ